jgi:hypothetical protein
VSTPAGLNSFCFYFSITLDNTLFRDGILFSRNLSTDPTSRSEQTNITASIYKCVFIIDFPKATAEKKVTKLISKYPQSSPAKSNNGFGTDAKAKIANHPYYFINFSIVVKIFDEALPMTSKSETFLPAALCALATK